MRQTQQRFHRLGLDPEIRGDEVAINAPGLESQRDRVCHRDFGERMLSVHPSRMGLSRAPSIRGSAT